MRITDHARERLVLRYGGMLADAVANIRSLLGPLAGQTAELTPYTDIHGVSHPGRHYPCGDVTMVLDETNTTVVTVLPTLLVIREGDAIPGVDPARTGLTNRARAAYRELTGVPDSGVEDSMRGDLARLKGRVAPAGALSRKYGRSTRKYKVNGVLFIFEATNQIVVAVVPARPATHAAARPLMELPPEWLRALAKAKPRCSSLALEQFARARGGGDATQPLRDVLHGAAEHGSIRPRETGYEAYLGREAVWLSADMQTITGYVPAA